MYQTLNSFDEFIQWHSTSPIMNYRAETQNALKRVRKWSQPASAGFMCQLSNSFDGMARNLWAPAINNHGGFGRWAFIEITDPWDAKNTIRAMLRGQAVNDIAKVDHREV